MKYRVEIYGYGAEVIIGTPNKEQMQILVDDSNESLTTKVMNFENSYYEIDDQLHVFGCELESSTIIIYDEDNNEVLNSETGLGLEICDEEDFSYWEYKSTEIDETQPLLMTVSQEKGTFFEGYIECDQFDIKKFRILIQDEVGLRGNTYGDIIFGATYDGEELDNYGGSTDGKSFDAYINFDKSVLRDMKIDDIL